MFTSIILAAGMGTRMKSEIPKVLHRVCGKPLCRWVIDESKKAGADTVAAVVGHKAELVKDELAMRVAMPFRRSRRARDMPLCRPENT